MLFIFQAAKIDQALAQYLEEAAQESTAIPELPMDMPVLKCPSCGLDMFLRNRREGNGKYIGCMGFPNCRNAIWFPSIVEEVDVSEESCQAVSIYANLIGGLLFLRSV